MPGDGSIRIPRRLPLLLVDEQVLLPGSSLRIPVDTSQNMNLVRYHLLNKSTIVSAIIGVVPKEPENIKKPSDDEPSIHRIGTAAVVIQITGTNWPQPSYTLLLTGMCRLKVESLLQTAPYVIGQVTQLDKLPGEIIDVDPGNRELLTLIDNFRQKATLLLDMLDVSAPLVAKLKRILNSVPDQSLPDVCASIIKTSYSEKLELLDTLDLTERLQKMLPMIMRQIEGVGTQQKIKPKMSSPIIQIQVPPRRFGPMGQQEGPEMDDITELEQKITSSNLPEHASKIVKRELKRLRNMPVYMPEHALTRNYLELIVDLPWNKSSHHILDINKARTELDTDHHGLDKLKRRVLEYLAVRQLRANLRGPILCFVGPPGVGKTSIGRSIASIMRREFHRISLGGTCDQADIRGHRRTYIGAMPGRIIQGLRTVGVNNPVFLLDEIDKLKSGVHGDPSAALLEVLDPEQNSNFVDHYLNMPFDLSQVLFIATANTLATIPAALLDRMEVIHVPGYTQEEKLQIAIRHLKPKQLHENGLDERYLIIPDDTLKLIISRYTREAGVRNLERKIGAVCRAVAVKVAEKILPVTVIQKGENIGATAVPGVENEETAVVSLPDEGKAVVPAGLAAPPPEIPIVVDEVALEDILGPPMYDQELSGRLDQPGVAMGLAWTALGGTIMYVEASTVDGDGKLVLTGQLGDVMKESAKLALNWVRNHSEEYGIKVSHGLDTMENQDVHIHFPAGAVEKDGPSAGVAIVTVLVSLFTGRCVLPDVAMTGEITLKGIVLPVGGIKEKVLAAHRAGVQKVILPQRNLKDIQEIPQAVQDNLTFIFVSHVDQALQAAFDGGFSGVETHIEPTLRSKL